MVDKFRTPVIIDTDPGVDDVIALLLAIASPELDILAIVVSFGNTDLESSYKNVLKTYFALSKHIEKYPDDAARFPGLLSSLRPILVRGSAGPMEGGLHSAQYFHGRDGLGNIADRYPDLDVPADMDLTSHKYLRCSNASGVEVVIDLLKAHPARTITYIALGPLTNFAQAMRKDPGTICEKLGRVVCMGGALDVPGNTSPTAEFNFFADPFAVKELLLPLPNSQKRTFPLDRFILLPLDVTTPHELRFPFYAHHVDPTFGRPDKLQEVSPLVHFTSGFLERTREVMCEFGKDAMELHDIVAVWCAIENPPTLDGDSRTAPPLSTGWRTTSRKFDIERHGDLTRGMLVVDRRDAQSAYTLGANRSEIQDEFERHLQDKRGIPAPVHVDHAQDGLAQETHGVNCVYETPGADALVQLLLKRVWGVHV